MTRTIKSSWRFEPGTEIAPGRTVTRPLGGGDRFEAWLGWDADLSVPVVFKMLRPDRVDRARARAAIRREAAFLRELAHPNLVRSLGADIDGPRPYIVLEFAEGPRLSTAVRTSGPLAPERLAALATELASALASMHGAGLLHLDVKPSNVIMGRPLRLIDLSIVRRMADVASISAPLGTHAYMAPEQCDAARLHEIGPWTDVWGLGATLYQAANGRRPFRRREGDAPHPQLTEPPRDFLPGIPPALEDVIRACLDPDRRARPSLRDLAKAFSRPGREASPVAAGG
jgi:eukaryotic-like serine/threonine-protein kinase